MSVPTARRHAAFLYNPDLYTRDELIRAFVARQPLLERLLETLRHADPESGPGHHLLVGPRGMGKTMLLRRVAAAIEEEPALAGRWRALVFPEEQYDVGSLADFWLNCLDALADALDREQAPRPRLDALDREIARLRSERDRAGEGVLAALVAEGERERRGLVLLVDNLDMVLRRIPGTEQWALREALSHHPGLAVLGASPAPLGKSAEYGAAFYDFFQVHSLGGLSLPETRELLLHLAGAAGDRAVEQRVQADPGRIAALHVLTGGSPRVLALLYQVLREDEPGRVRDDLEHLLDQATTYYKARVEERSDQEQQVFHALAVLWDPASAALGVAAAVPSK